MARHAIREYDGKRIMCKWLASRAPELKLYMREDQFVPINPKTDLATLHHKYPALQKRRLVAKPDQLIKRRGKAGLLKLNATWAEAKAWIEERRGKEQKVEKVSGILDYFLVEPFVPHQQNEEHYVAITSDRDGDTILFHHEGGVDVGNVDEKALRLQVDVESKVNPSDVETTLLKNIKDEQRRALLKQFITQLFTLYRELHFALLEINPLVVTSATSVDANAKADELAVVPLDMAAKIDETAKFENECGKYWGTLDLPPPFGRPLLPEEEYITSLDAKTGASLKLTILNPKGRIWTMVAGGGASVVYADTLTDLGAGDELANYGEYSGAPTLSLTFEYAKTILQLMTKEKHPDGKVLIIGGGIANFTNVAETFKGIIKALTRFRDQIKEHNIKIFVRRGGPNWQEGLNLMRQAGNDLDLDMVVHGPDRHITAVVSLALKIPFKEANVTPPSSQPSTPTGGRSLRSNSASLPSSSSSSPVPTTPTPSADNVEMKSNAHKPLFSSKTRAFVYGMQPKAVQNMLDFDYLCKRKTPSVAAMVYPFSGNHYQKFYWNSEEILIPIFQHFSEAAAKFPEVDTVVNFASFRSVFESTSEILDCDQIRCVAIIAEGVPEQRTKMLIKQARQRGVTIIGPATVGGIKPGCFRIGNTGGMLDNILASKLYRPGSVAYVARSGGMSNELNNIISRNSDGVYEGIAIGGDMYPGTSFMDHILRYQADDNVKMIVVLGEVGGDEEYKICRALRNKTITKPLVAWCIGTCAKVFPYEVQFGHAGACASGNAQTADAKNLALRRAGALVPANFQHFGVCISSAYKKLVRKGDIVPKEEQPPPNIPVDYSWARKLGLVRKPSAFISSISDERGTELQYAGMPISEVFSQGMGVGGVLGLLWFRKRLPGYFCRFIEMVLMVTADHGPAVSGAHNTIVCARAGKDLISSLTSGLLTIGPRFGGALDGAAEKFAGAYDKGLTPQQFVTEMRKKKELIPGIGHKVKSLENPDVRVTIVKEFARKNFKTCELLDYALQVEQITTKKKSNLILNVDGCIGCCFVDLLRSCGAFTRDEVDEYLNIGVLNGLFVLGRSLGFIGHFIDQKRLKQGLYRHPTEDISYVRHL